MNAMANYDLALPEIFLLGMTCIVLVFDLFISDRNRVFTYLLAQITLLGTALITISQMSGQSSTAFGGTFVRDAMGDVLKLFVYVITASVFLYSRDYLAQRNLFKGEYYILGLFGVLGMMVMISAGNFLTIYLGLELMSLAMYSMVAFNRDSAVSTESAMKYFVLGAIASGMLLYGMSMIYGVTGTLDLSKIAAYISTHGVTNIMLSFGLVFLVVGIAFKLGAVPFHMWLPDVYHGAPTSVTLYIASAPKIAAFAMAMRLLVDGMELMHADWQQMLIILSVLSLAIGNIVAIAQTNLKRMLAYSTISHVGYLVLGILSGKADGYSASMFYTLTYALMTLGSFGMIILLSRSGFEADNLDDFKGLNERSPWYAFIMLILMFSMAGVPPTVGFFAKLWVLEAVIKADMVWLAAVAVFFSIIGAYYYIRIIKLMYFDKPEDSRPIECGKDMRILVSTNGLVVLALGIIPGALMSVCNLVIS